VACLAVLLVVTAATVAAVADDGQPFGWSAAQTVPAASLIPSTATGYSLTGVSCGSPSLCVTVDSIGGAHATHDPSAGSWSGTVIDAGGALNAVSCPDESLCVAADRTGTLLASGDPGAPSPTWTPAHVGSRAITGVSCPTERLCVAVDDAGSAWATTDPLGGAPSWRAAAIDAVNAPLDAVSCASSSALCVAVDGHGDVVASPDPTGGSGKWATASVDAGRPLVGVSCPSAARCLAVDEFGNVLASDDPLGGTEAWQLASSLGSVFPVAIACPATDRCVVLGSDDALASDDPVGGADGWSTAHLEIPGPLTPSLTGIACPSVMRCVAVDGGDNTFAGVGSAQTGSVDVALLGGGLGTVTGPGIACPPTCAGSYARGTGVTLAAAPAAGSLFAGWGGACSGIGACALTVGAVTDVVASFVPLPPPPSFVLSVSIAGAGSVRGSGIACPPTCRSARPVGEAVALTAVPAGGWRFAGWSGCAARGDPCRVAMRADRAVSVLFAQLERTRIVRATIRPRARAARFAFRTSPSGVPVRCALVRRRASRWPAPRYATCRSPKAYAHLPNGRYRFFVGPADDLVHAATRAFRVP
jgi:hypothetical protein